MNDPISTPDAKQRLLAAAIDIFAEKGYKPATIREIVDKAQANIAAVNYHFGDKERLYIAACKHAHACSSFPSGPPQWPKGVPPIEKLKQFICMMVKGMTAPASPAAMTLMMREMANPTEAAREIVKESIQPLAFALRDVIRELFPKANEHRIRMIGFSVMGQCLFYRQNRNFANLIFGPGTMESLPTEEIANHIVRLMAAALGHGPAIDRKVLEAPL